jgi:hypothetical protein
MIAKNVPVIRSNCLLDKKRFRDDVRRGVAPGVLVMAY